MRVRKRVVFGTAVVVALLAAAAAAPRPSTTEEATASRWMSSANPAELTPTPTPSLTPTPTVVASVVPTAVLATPATAVVPVSAIVAEPVVTPSEVPAPVVAAAPAAEPPATSAAPVEAPPTTQAPAAAPSEAPATTSAAAAPAPAVPSQPARPAPVERPAPPTTTAAPTPAPTAAPTAPRPGRTWTPPAPPPERRVPIPVPALPSWAAPIVVPGTPARDALQLVPVKDRVPVTGYDRAAFGPEYADIDGNGCDQRNDVLRRDLVGVVLVPGTADCVVGSGTLHDRYTGRTLGYANEGPRAGDVRVDHVVSLVDAWQKGAQLLTPDQRTWLANDPLNLVATEAAAEEQKADADAARWLPPNTDARCWFVARQVAVKLRYQLWVTWEERRAMDDVLATCPGQPLPA
ncbi:Protein of unknown function [Pseudonocardia thermophila]|uniref:GmrSD restriction endonucleases C-terminal domain-containing protein n=1 Tax=Pseudonocardia thermophila TaxID=1848 RepID=A0A1M6ZQR1_PSETH|nr:HNH endonuclease family protein [Pseudonocardia thermophila]SHL32675.1 Protein of unknown function [Pseudonocardia thermophila]